MGAAMRILLACLIVISGLASAQAQVHIENAQVLRTGTYKIDKYKTIKDASISTGMRSEATPVIQHLTTVIPAKLDTIFGLDVLVRGSPRSRVIPVRVVWHYPAPGIRNPNTGVAKRTDEFTTTLALNNKTTFYWSLSKKYTLVPGTWTFELWHGDRLLINQAFVLE